MREITGVSPTTVNHMIRDAGKVYFNMTLADLRSAATISAVKTAIATGTELGATRGGSSFALGRTFRNMEADGLLGPTKNLRRLERVEPVLTVNPVEITADNIVKAIAGGAGADTAGGALQEITGGEAAATDYIGNVVLLTHHRSADEPVLFVLTDCLAVNAPDFGTTDNDEMVLSLEFAAHFDPASAGVEPWSIFTHETIA